MKQFSRILACALALVMILSVPAAAAELPEAEVSVLLNGDAVDFTGATPKIIDNRTFLPFQAIFSALGFEADSINWDEETGIVSAVRAGSTVSMTIGEKLVTVTDSTGTATTVDADVAPYVDEANGQPYGPARFVAEAVE